MKRHRKSSKQLEMPLLFGRGGPGRNQGRKKRKDLDYVPHTRRPFLDSRHPVHVSTRVMRGLPSLRGRRLWGAVRQGFVYGCKRDRSFRIVHFSVQGQHIHIICEAKNRRALSRGVQGFKIRVARAINRVMKRRGTVFAERYHETIITNPTQCRRTIAYVLNNQRHHGYERSTSYRRSRIDPFSSGQWFEGWTIEAPKPWGQTPPTSTDDECPRAGPRTWLLRIGWRRGGGAISPDHIPSLPRDAAPLPVW